MEVKIQIGKLPKKKKKDCFLSAKTAEMNCLKRIGKQVILERQAWVGEPYSCKRVVGTGNYEERTQEN